MVKMTRPSYRPLVPRLSNNSGRSNGTPPPGEPLVSARAAGKPRCPPAISRLRVEKIEGGLLVAGFVVAANCQIVLPIFGFLFMLVGCVLTAASYRGCGEHEEPDHYAARIAFTGNSRVLGPICIVAGAIMTLAGIVLCLLMRSAQKRQRRLAFHCPIHGDFYPLSPQSSRKNNGAGWWGGVRGWLGLDAPAERPPPRCPRSADPAPPEPCPPPLPFLVPSDSVVGMASVLGAPLSPEQTFGSIKSLAVTREVASFPLSRSPTPPPLRESISEEDAKYTVDIPNAVPELPDVGGTPTTFRVLECKITTTDEVSKPAVVRLPQLESPAARLPKLDTPAVRLPKLETPALQLTEPRDRTVLESCRTASKATPEPDEGKG